MWEWTRLEALDDGDPPMGVGEGRGELEWNLLAAVVRIHCRATDDKVPVPYPIYILRYRYNIIGIQYQITNGNSGRLGAKL
jgi:hypothetical protein